MRPDPGTGRSRRRFSPLLPALALLLGSLCLFAPAPAEALTIPGSVRSAFITGSGTPSARQDSTVWSATLTPVEVTGGIGCESKSECDMQLSDNSFTVGGQPYHFLDLSVRRSGPLLLTLSTAASLALRRLKFCVGSTEFDFSIFATASHYWMNHGLTWTVGTPVSLSIGTSCGQAQTPSTDATLSGLTASGSTSASGTFAALSIGTFAASTAFYSATVANRVSHAKLTPTVNDSNATVKVGKGSSLTAVASGSASGAIALSMGPNALRVEVTAEDGTTTRTYTVTVTRQQGQDGGGGVGGGTSQARTVSLLASPNPVDEGETVTVTARLSSAASSRLTIPLTLRNGTAGDGDYGSLSSITIDSGSRTGTGTVTTHQDSDTADETFTVALGSLPSSVGAGSPDAVEVTILDDDGGDGGGGGGGGPTVSLLASPNPVDEGEEVTVTARLSRTLSSAVTIPLTLTNGTAEDGDYGSLSRITIDSGSRTGTGTITTSQDADTDDETFTVALGSLPSPVRAGRPDAVEVTILDDGLWNRAPKVSASCDPCLVGPGGEVRLTATASDPDGDPLTYAWSARRGDLVGPADAAAALWRAPARIGRATIHVRVSDGRGGTASARVSVAVANSPPAFAERSYTFELRENEDGRVRPVPLGTAVAEDPDGDEVTYALASGAADLFAVGAGDGAVTYVGPGEDYETEPNRYELTVSARDPRGAESRAQVIVKVVNVNELPVAAADTAATVEDTEVVIDVLANDTDVEGDGLRVESVTQPTHGTARIAAGGGVEYAPEADWHGTDRFTYTVSDGNGGTATAEVEVVVEPVNDAPEAVADTVRTAEDEPVVINVLANDTDVEDDALSVESVTAPSHGTARIAAGGGVEYAPETDYYGSDRFTYTVSDGNGGTTEGEVEVEVEPVNDAPEAMADTAATAEDEPVVIDVLANDTDVEDDALSVESVTAPTHGTARAVASGGVEYAPEADYHGPDRFTYTVSDGNGGTATADVEVLVASVNDAPETVGEIPDQALDEGGRSVALDLAPYFADRDGDPLAYTAVSSNPGAAAVSVAGSALSLTPIGYGPASIEVTASDPGGLSAAQTFTVNTSDRMVRAVLDETLAAMARAHLASARMTLGRRVGPDGGADERSRLTVGGRSIPLGRDAAHQAAGRLLEGWAVSRLWRGAGLAEAGRAAERRLAQLAADAADGRGTGLRPPGPADLASSLGLNGLGGMGSLGGMGGLGASGGGTQFLFAWGGGELGAQDAGGGGRWRFWGQGDLQTFAGDPVPERGYEGDLLTGWAGVDRALDERWLAGLALARSRGGGDWRAGTAGGRLETSLTAVHPYVRWSDGATSVWTMAGGGRGSAENERATGRVGESGLGLGLGLVEVRRRLTPRFGLRADAAWARLATGVGRESVDDRSAAVHQQRLGVELASTTRHLDALAIELFGQASLRRDGGAGQTGSGLEVAGGFRAARGSVRVNAQGRFLVLHSAEGYEERGLGVTLSVGSPAEEEGLSFSVSPRWGGPAAASGALWDERLGGLGPRGPAAEGPWSLDARGRYALRLPGGRLLAWSGGFSRSGDGWGLTIGGGLELVTRASPPQSPR